MATKKNMTPSLFGDDIEGSQMVGVELLLSGEEPAQTTTIIELDDGGVEITLGDEEELDLESAPFDANLAEYLDDGVLQTISSDLIASVDGDIQSRKDWADAYVKGLDVLGF